MRELNLLFIFVLLSVLGVSQNSVPRTIVINADYKVVMDVTPTPDSIPNGKYKCIYRNKVILKGTTRNGKPNGQWIAFHMNGQQKMKARYIDGQRHGEWIQWSDKGTVLSKQQFNKGIPVGHWQGHYSNYAKAIDIVYTPKGTPTQCVHYYPGEIIALNHEYEYEGTIVKSTLSYYYDNFNIYKYEQQTNNVVNGQMIVYHDNGAIRESFIYDYGRLSSIVETHAEGGMPRDNDLFRHGNGNVFEYYRNGNTFSETAYKKGLRDGSISINDFGGKVVGTGYFSEGEPSGKWDIYSKFYHVIIRVDFDTIPGLEYLRFKISPAKKEIEEGPALNGYRHGLWKSFDAYGEIVSEENYRFGYLDGEQRYYEGTKLARTEQYSNGNKKGKTVLYDLFGKLQSEEIYESESIIDTNWFHPPKKGWYGVSNKDMLSNNVLLYFYPSLPGSELSHSKSSFAEKQGDMFLIQRTMGYDYVPKIKPASFIGGYQAEKEYIRKYMKIPTVLKSKKIEGTILVRYRVNELGMISETEVLKSMGMGLDEAVVKIINEMPRLNPATFNGVIIPSYIVREIDFNF